MLTIREMAPEDLDAVLEIYNQGLEEGRSTFNTQCPTKQEWDAGHLPICRLVAVDGDTVAGWIALSPTSARPCYRGVCEVSIYLHRDYRGKGLGTRLMAAEVEASEAAGIWQLYAAIFSTNTASIKMCRNNGWRVIGTRERIAKDRFGVWQNTTLMERRSKVAGMD